MLLMTSHNNNNKVVFNGGGGGGETMGKVINLDRDELLKLLSVFEGEMQARDEVIEILKSEKNNTEAR